jgi:hypothetical protein
VTAKERHKQRLLKFLGDPENDYPPRQDYAKLLKVSVVTLYKHFPPDELQEIENEAYEIRKKNSTKQRAEVLKSMFSEAKQGNVSAATLFLERTEGKVKEVKDINMTGEMNVNVNVIGVKP